MKFRYAMTLAELRKRTSKTCYKPVKFLSKDAKELKNFSENDFCVLKYLVKAAKIIDDIYMKLENPLNGEFSEFLKQDILKGNEKAILTYKLFLSQKSIFSPDSLGNQTVLFKDFQKPLGLGYYPLDLTKEEFLNIINQMAINNQFDEISQIVSSRSIVFREGNKLKGVDIVDYFADDFKKVASYLRKAIEYSDDKKFNQYLELQAAALETADEMLDAKADVVWAKLDKSKFEFTITRECYNDKMTISLLDDENLKQILLNHNIEIRSKDDIGVRVGVVNKSGTKLLKKLKSLVDIEAKYMPLKSEYSNIQESENIAQTAVDVDLIYLAGDQGAYRASIVTAENLPNDDKKALTIGGGRRNVYHRQVRKRVNKKLYKNLICSEQLKYFSPEADHYAVICHENTHTLGPKFHKNLGMYDAILEEYKADMGMYAFLDEFEEAGMFSDEEVKQIMVSSLTNTFLKGKPTLAQAHRTRALMICNRLITENAITIIDDGKLYFDFEKIKKLTKIMMKEVIRIQIDNNFAKAKDYVAKWFVWTDKIEDVAKIIRQNSKMLNGYIECPLAEELIATN